MEAQKIKVELELTPEIAFFLSYYLSTTAQGDFTLQKDLSLDGKKQLHDIGQSILEQVETKTDFQNLALRSLLISLKKGK